MADFKTLGEECDFWFVLRVLNMYVDNVCLSGLPLWRDTKPKASYESIWLEACLRFQSEWLSSLWKEERFVARAVAKCLYLDTKVSGEERESLGLVPKPGAGFWNLLQQGHIIFPLIALPTGNQMLKYISLGDLISLKLSQCYTSPMFVTPTLFTSWRKEVIKFYSNEFSDECWKQPCFKK